MTNKEALVAVLGGFEVPDDTLEKALLDVGIRGAQEYVSDNAEDIDVCAIDILQLLLSVPNVSEGGYSISYDRGAIKERLNFLSAKHSLLNPLSPYVTSKPIW